MKVINKILILSSLALGILSLNLPAQNISFNEYAYDLDNNAVQLNVKNVLIGEEETVDVSKTFVQYGIRENNNYVLRFATAVKGSVKKITYTRTAEGKDDFQKEVTQVYQGILSNGEAVYYNPVTQDVTTDDAYKGLYYWACYTAEYAPDSAEKGLDLTVSATVVDSEENEVVSNPRTTSLETLLEANKKEYSITGSVLEDTYIESNDKAAKGTDYSKRDSLALNSKYYRVFYKLDVSDILESADFESTKDTGKFILDIGIAEGASAVNDWAYNLSGAGLKYGEEYTASVPFSSVTWNSVQTNKTYSSMQTDGLTKIFKEDTIKVSKNLSNENDRLQIKLTYDQIKDHICLDAGDYYGYAVFMFNASATVDGATAIKVASLEHATLAPTLTYVYEK